MEQEVIEEEGNGSPKKLLKKIIAKGYEIVCFASESERNLSGSRYTTITAVVTKKSTQATSESHISD